MRLLIVASYNVGRFSPFVQEQANALSREGVEIDYCGVVGKGVFGYYRNRAKLLQKIQHFKPDIIHAHYGLSGLLANLQRHVPVITTFHGSDIHSNKIVLFLSRIAMRLSVHVIFVSRGLLRIAKYNKRNCDILSCGLELSLLTPIDREQARRQLGWETEKVYILFAGAFDNQIKNYDLARKSVKLIQNCELIELKGYSRSEVNLIMNASNVLLTTSLRESGPLVVKEAMACGLPIVSTDVGDVKWVIGDTDGCFITPYNPVDCADRIKNAILFSQKYGKTRGRERIIELGLDNEIVVKKLIAMYQKVIKNRTEGE